MHRNARLTFLARRTLLERIAAGRAAAHVAHGMGVSCQTAYKWWRRWLEEGAAGLEDRPSRPHRSPARVTASLERRIERIRRRGKLGPARIGFRLGMHASTVHRVLCRRGRNRLAWLDRPSGQLIRRSRRDKHARPGDLLHIDVKKLERMPPGGGWCAHGRGQAPRSRTGYAFIHSAVDDHTRLAYSEILGDERAVSAAAFLGRARAWFAERGVEVRAVLTDNGGAYRSYLFGAPCRAAGVRAKRTRLYRPQTNGKVERFHRTMVEEWAYVRVYCSEAERAAALEPWLHRYNHHPCHTAIGGEPPISRVNNVPGHYS